MTQVVRKREVGSRTLGQVYARWRYQIGLDPTSYVSRAIILVLFAVFFGVPILWLFIAPTKSHRELISMSSLAIGNLQNVMDSWQRLAAFNRGIMFTWARNSVWYVGVALVLCMAVTIPAGYLLANVSFKGRKALLWATLILMLLPGDATVLPMYMLLFLMRMINKPWAVILPAGLAPAAVYLTYTYYRTVMHKDLVDAAKVDGCSDLAMFWHIGLPLARSVVAMLLFTQFSALWNGFFAASIFLERDLMKTLPVGIAVMAQQTGALNPNPTAYGKVLLLRPDMALVSIFTVTPVILIYLVSQRLIVRAATAGAIQGE
jgi:multiple sugar transport system permease protein